MRLHSIQESISGAPGRRHLLSLSDLWDIPVNYQKVRHGRWAQRARHLLARCFMGKDAWPMVFRAPRSPEEWPQGTSPHLYIHLPFCRRICPHCPYNKVLYHKADHLAYGRALRRELEGYLRRPDTPRVQSLYFGGGTPSLTPDLIELGIRSLSLILEKNAEIAVEVHPCDAQGALLERLRGAGVNRISLGAETFDANSLHRLGRGYSPIQAEEAIRLACSLGFDCVDVNLIYGIPGQSVSQPAADAARCLALGVDQISAYPLLTFVHTPLGHQVAEGRFPVYGDRWRLRSQKEISRICREAGFLRTSVWSFTRPGIDPYSTVTREDYVGFGAGAGSKVGGIFWFNTFSVEAYHHAAMPRPALILQAADRFSRVHWLYWQIYRTCISPIRYQELFHRDLERDYGALLLLLQGLGLAYKDRDEYRLTEQGAIWVHRLQSLFSLTYIDELWQRCQKEAWPEEVVLT